MRGPLSLILILFVSSCGISVIQTKKMGGYPIKVWKVKGNRVKPFVGVILIGEPGLRAEVYIKSPGGLAQYLAKKGVEVWVYAIGQKDTFESIRDGVLPALVDMMSVELGIEKISILCHGFSCLPAMEAVVRGYRKSFIRDMLMVSPPLFSWGFTRAFKYMLNKNISSETVKKVPPFSNSGESLLNLLYCDERTSEGNRSFVLNCLKPIPPFWISFMKKFISKDVNYLNACCNLPVPVMVIAGQLDSFIPYWSSIPPEINKEKCNSKFRFFGRANFDRKEYSHLGLLVGKDAHKEVFPFIYDWLKFKWRETNWMRDYSSFPGE